MNNEILKRILSSLILIPVALFFIIKGSYFFNLFILICFLISSYEWHIMSKNKKYNLPGFILIIFSFYTVYWLRNEVVGEYTYFLMVVLICVFTDIGGYVFGKIIKGPKLTKISPNKTYSGMVGGYLCSIIFIIVYVNNVNFLLPLRLELDGFIFVIAISTVSQLGDIIISYFKRLSKVKNTGKIIPGHGGLLDRIDGMLFAFPTTYLIFKILY